MTLKVIQRLSGLGSKDVSSLVSKDRAHLSGFSELGSLCPVSQGWSHPPREPKGRTEGSRIKGKG